MQIIVQFISLLVSGVSVVFGFLLSIGSIIYYSVQMLPQDLSSALLISFSIIISVRVLELLP